MSNKILSPQQSAVRERALNSYIEAFEARGLPVPESEGFASARCEVRLDGMARTVWANGRAGPWLDLRGLMKEFYRLNSETVGATLHDTVWAKFNAAWS